MAVCTHCGRESQGNERYCMSCGQPLTGDNQPAAVGAGVLAQPMAMSAQGASDAPASSAAPVAAPVADGARDAAAAASTPQSRLVVRRLASADGGSADGPSIEVGEFILDGRDVAIGRAPSCDIVLEGDQLASRRHALLRSRSDGYTVVDLGSSNGTYINDLEIREAALLHEGDRISIGGHELVYSTSPASPHASLAGVKLAPPAGAPMTETDPNAEAVNSSETAESPAISLMNGLDSAPAEAADGLSVADELGAAAADDEAAGLDEAAPPNDDYYFQDVSDRQDEPEQPEQQEMPAMATEAESVSAQSTDFSASGITDADFEALQMQLAQVSDALARKAGSESRVINRLRTALEVTRDHLSALLDKSSAESMPSSDVSHLISVARQAAENPRHLDYLTALGEHAGEIADALEASNTPSAGVSADELDAIRAKVDEALG